MRTLNDIKVELDGATARRSELWRQLARGRDAAAAAELARLSTRIAELWEELRTVRARRRFGSPELIAERAERHKRFERELKRLLAEPGGRKAA